VLCVVMWRSVVSVVCCYVEVCCECCVLLCGGLCDDPIFCPGDFYRVCVCVCVSLSVIRYNNSPYTLND